MGLIGPHLKKLFAEIQGDENYSGADKTNTINVWVFLFENPKMCKKLQFHYLGVWFSCDIYCVGFFLFFY